MTKKALSVILSILFSFVVFNFNMGLSLDSEGIIRLKEAGISDETIQLIVKEKSIETCALTVHEILSLKKAGLSDKTIQMLIREGSFLKDREPIIYGKEIKSIKFVTIKDIIELKDAGLSDEVIQAIIIYGSRDVDEEERKKAWEMLENMGIVIDMRDRR